MKKNYLKIAVGFAFIFQFGTSQAQSEYTTSEDLDIFDLSLEELLGVNVSETNKFALYGFINSNVERVFNEPSIDVNGNTITENAPLEWSPLKNFHIYGSGELSNKISVLFNIAAPDGEFTLRNAYGNFKINDIFQVRVGKMYRKFGLYNEKLDQIPTFTGIEAPELFDTDHLFLTRTTTLMLHGNKSISNGQLSYALTSGNSEAGPSAKVLPLGWDLRFKSKDLGLVVGTSGFTSSINGELTQSTVGFNAGSPKGGVLPWMDGDHYQVYGGFVEKKLGNFLIQAEYWASPHNAERNATNTLELIENGGINEMQRANFLGENAGIDNSLLTENDIITKVNYTAQTAYIRLCYTINTKKGQFVPYFFYDWMSNPEVIQSKSWGGDNEAGLSDDGQFSKPSLGVVYRPIQSVAIKLDGSLHVQEYNGQRTTYPEIRMDFSFAFDALKGVWTN